MTVTPSSVVSRVVDYEPPILAVASKTPVVTAVAVRTPRPRILHAVPEPPSPRQRAAATFADAALRSVLEVMDQRRPAAQLRPLLVGGLTETVTSLRRATNQHAAAVLRRVRLQAVDPHEQAFEVSAAYSRAHRVHALACRVELVPTLRGHRWQVTALHIG